MSAGPPNTRWFRAVLILLGVIAVASTSLALGLLFVMVRQ